MNTGLGNLTELKQQLLAAALQPQTNYDAIITAIGRGAAARFDSECNRSLAYAAGDSAEFSADRSLVFLPRYPLVAVTKVELKLADSADWAEQLGAVSALRSRSGMVSFGSAFGGETDTVRVTYTGGFWFDTEEAGNTPQPAGTTKLPEDLRLAWYLTCRKIWEAIDKTGAKLTAVGPGAQFVTGTLGDLKLVPDVEATLRKYTRYQLS